MPQIQNVVLIGASGILGTAIFNALLHHPNSFTITILTRLESTATFPSSTTTTTTKVKVIRTTYTLPNLIEAFQKQDAVICTTGLSAINDQTTLIEACVASSVYRYITNDYGNAPDFEGLPELEFARVPKQRILEFVQQKASASSSTATTNNPNPTPFTYTALATGHFLDHAILNFPQAFGISIPHRTARLVDDGLEPFSATTLSDIAAAVVDGILCHPRETENRYLLVRSLETTQRELVAEFERQTYANHTSTSGHTSGGAGNGNADEKELGKWTITNVSSADLYDQAKEKMRQADGKVSRDVILALLPVQIFEGGKKRSSFPRERYDNELLGLKERTVEEVVRDCLARSSS